MSAHTPGPWVATANGIHKGSECVALTYMEPREQRHADARLIAAAPELLDACEQALSAFDGSPSWFSRDNVSAIGALRYAIAKAEGRA